MSGALIAPILGAVQSLRAAFNTMRAALTDGRIAKLDQLDAPVSGATRRVYGVPLTAGLNASVARPLGGASAAILGPHPQANVVDVSAAAGVWQSVLSVTGAGILRGAGVFGQSSAAGQSLSLRITIDGVSYERTCAASASTSQWMLAAVADQTFSLDGNSNYVVGPTAEHAFEASLLVEVKRSSTATASAFFTHSLTR